MGAGNDSAAACLTENFSQARDGHDAALNQIAQDRARAHRRELIDVADKEQTGIWRMSPQQGIHERDIKHRNFIDHNEVTLERASRVTSEGACRLNFQESMDGKR